MNCADELCDEDLEALSSWEPLLDSSKDGALAERGWEEFRNIGSYQLYRKHMLTRELITVILISTSGEFSQ